MGLMRLTTTFGNGEMGDLYIIGYSCYSDINNCNFFFREFTSVASRLKKEAEEATTSPPNQAVQALEGGCS
jgi:hypothetical protein